MRWIERNNATRAAGILVPALLCTLLLSGAGPEKHLSVYSVAANYSLPLVQRSSNRWVK